MKTIYQNQKVYQKLDSLFVLELENENSRLEFLGEYGYQERLFRSRSTKKLLVLVDHAKEVIFNPQ